MALLCPMTPGRQLASTQKIQSLTHTFLPYVSLSILSLSHSSQVDQIIPEGYMPPHHVQVELIYKTSWSSEQMPASSNAGVSSKSQEAD